MIVRSARWGVFLLVLAALLLAGITIAALAAGTAPPKTLSSLIMPIVALVLGIAALFAGHVSYPRVQNLRVYLAGYSIGLQSIAYTLLAGIAASAPAWLGAVPDGYETLLSLSGLLMTLVCSIVRPFPTYRSTQVITWSLLLLQTLLFVLIRFVPALAAVPSLLEAPRLLSVQAGAVMAVTVAVVLVNVFARPESFYLRGATSGLALLAGGTWLLAPVLDTLGSGFSPGFLALLYAAVAPLFLVVSVIAHVFARMEHRVSYDPLLQIYNRQYCNQVLAEQSSIPTRPPFTVMMIDIDHFKQVNDTYGHQAGDRILFAVAQQVQKSVVPEGIVCRYGGEELIVFLPGRSARDAAPLAQRLRISIEQLETAFRAKRISVTVSIGLSDRLHPRQQLPHIVHAADKALYIAKENGRNQVRLVRIKQQAR